MSVEQARPLVRLRNWKRASGPQPRLQLAECEHGRVLCSECDAAEIDSVLSEIENAHIVSKQ
jgi:hypothetical protein